MRSLTWGFAGRTYLEIPFHDLFIHFSIMIITFKENIQKRELRIYKYTCNCSNGINHSTTFFGIAG